MSNCHPSTSDISAADLPGFLRGNPAIVLHFWTAWQNNCRVLDSLLQTIQTDNPSDLKFLSISLDDERNWSLARSWGITSLPVLTCHIGGGMIDRLTGLRSERLLRHKIYQWNEQAARVCASPHHKSIVSNLMSRVGNHFERHHQTTSCHSSVIVTSTDLKTYPDVTIVCGEPYFHSLDETSITNPIAVFEVLSKSTEAYDRGEKWANYQRLDSLQEYVLVSQNKPRVEQYVRQSDGSWKFTMTEGLDSSFFLPSLEIALPLVEVYDWVTFTESQTHEEANHGARP